MEMRKQQCGDVCDFTCSGQFTFADHELFRNVLNEMANPEAGKIVLRLNEVEFVDSAALGMLLLALDEAENHHKALVLAGPRGQVKKMFTVARFDHLFNVVEEG